MGKTSLEEFSENSRPECVGFEIREVTVALDFRFLAWNSKP